LKKPKKKNRLTEKLRPIIRAIWERRDTYYVGFIKGVGRIYQQTFIDTYTKAAVAKLYDRKGALVAADTLNDRILPFFEGHGIRLLRILTDRGTEYCGAREHHEYEIYLALEDIDHSKTKEAEFYAIAFRKKNLYYA